MNITTSPCVSLILFSFTSFCESLNAVPSGLRGEGCKTRMEEEISDELSEGKYTLTVEALRSRPIPQPPKLPYLLAKPINKY